MFGRASEMKLMASLWRAVWLLPVGILLTGGLALADDHPIIIDPDPKLEELPREIPELSPGDVKRSSEIIAGDPLLQELSRLGDFRTEDRGPWHTSEMDLLGVSELMSFSEPVTLEKATWPALQYDVGRHSYEPFSLTYSKLNAITEVRVLVDLRTETVVAITPLVGEDIEVDPETKFPAVESGGLG